MVASVGSKLNFELILRGCCRSHMICAQRRPFYVLSSIASVPLSAATSMNLQVNV